MFLIDHWEEGDKHILLHAVCSNDCECVKLLQGEHTMGGKRTINKFYPVLTAHECAYGMTQNAENLEAQCYRFLNAATADVLAHLFAQHSYDEMCAIKEFLADDYGFEAQDLWSDITDGKSFFCDEGIARIPQEAREEIASLKMLNECFVEMLNGGA